MLFIDLKRQYRALEHAVRARMERVLEHGQYILGPEVAELEERLADYVGVRHCVGVASGTDALLLALMALEVGRGDEVVAAAFSFVAPAEMSALLGARTVLADIREDTFNLDPAALPPRPGERVRAVIAVDLFGQCADYGAIEPWCQTHGAVLIEDAAQSFGANQGGRRAGSFGDIACTSFFPSKPLGCYGDGGACFTNDDALATRLRALRVHGDVGRYEHRHLGTNARLDTLQAAVLLAKLEVFDEEVQRREQVAGWYRDAITELGLPVTLPRVQAGNRSVYAQFTIRVADRERFSEHMARHEIPTAVHYPKALHEQAALAGLGYPRGSFPQAERAAAEVISLPMHPYLERTTVRWIAETAASVLEAAMPPADQASRAS